MKIGTYEVPAAAIDAALRFIKNSAGSGEGFVLGDVKHILRSHGCEWQAMDRAADRLLQQEKRAKRIEWDGDYWRSAINLVTADDVRGILKNS